MKNKNRQLLLAVLLVARPNVTSNLLVADAKLLAGLWDAYGKTLNPENTPNFNP